MRVLGAAPANGHVSLVVLDVDETQWSVVDTTRTRKIPLGDHEDAVALRAFKNAVSAFVNSHGVDAIVIRRCTYKGQKRSGAPSIKMETLLQLLPVKVELVSAQSIARHLKGIDACMPDYLAQYQSDAFATALWATKIAK